MVDDKMTVYEKLLKARMMVHSKPMQKSGYNGFAKYNYYTLDDIIPSILKACETFGIVTLIDFQNDLATLTVVDVDSPTDVIVFSTPTSLDAVKGSKIQNIGAMETYIRRYLYVNAFDIIQTEEVDMQDNTKAPQNNAPVTPPTITKDEAGKLWNSYDAKGKEIIKKTMETFNIKLLTDLQVSNLGAFTKTVNRELKNAEEIL